MTALRIPQHIGIALLAETDDDKLHIERENLVQHTGNQVKTLLVRQTRNDGKHRNVPLGKPELLLQRGLDRFLDPRIANAVMLRQRKVGMRIVGMRIDAVQNAGQRVFARAEQSVQPLAVVFHTDFFGIGGADRRDPIGVDNAALHERQ